MFIVQADREHHSFISIGGQPGSLHGMPDQLGQEADVAFNDQHDIEQDKSSVSN